MNAKIKTWLKRYIPAEFTALLGALISGIIANIIFANPVITAVSATWGDNVGYYGTIIFRDIRKQKKGNQSVSFIKIVRNMIFEFGPGEIFDSFLIRPFAMYLFPKLLNNLALGLLVGKVTADIVFYIPTVVSYELRTKFLRE